jgi:excisionase family DNA binding protein
MNDNRGFARTNTPKTQRSQAESRLLTLQEVAAHLALSTRTVRDLVKAGRLTAYRIGRLYRFRVSAVERYLASLERGQFRVIGGPVR